MLLHRSIEENLSRKEICSEFSHFLLSHHVQVNTGFGNPCSNKSCARRSFPKAESPHPATGFSLLGLNEASLDSAVPQHSSYGAFSVPWHLTCFSLLPAPKGDLIPRELHGNGNLPFPRQPHLPCQPRAHIETTQVSFAARAPWEGGTGISQFHWAVYVVITEEY